MWAWLILRSNPVGPSALWRLSCWFGERDRSVFTSLNKRFMCESSTPASWKPKHSFYVFVAIVICGSGVFWGRGRKEI